MGKKKSGFLKEFKEFAMKGNMLDLAVGVIVGGAFKTVVDALTNSVIMPVVSMFLGGLSFEEWKIRLPLSGARGGLVLVGTMLSTQPA